MKDKNLAAILAFFGGQMGLHRFYLGQPGLAFFYFVPLLGAFIGLIDAISFLSMSEETFNTKYNMEQYRTITNRTVRSSSSQERERRYQKRQQEREVRERARRQTQTQRQPPAAAAATPPRPRRPANGPNRTMRAPPSVRRGSVTFGILNTTGPSNHSAKPSSSTRRISPATSTWPLPTPARKTPIKRFTIWTGP